MAGFRDCILSARDQGAITPEEADDLIRRYEAHRRARAGEPDPEAAAKSGLADELARDAARKRRLAALTLDAHDAITAHLHGYRDLKGEPDVYEASMRLIENFGHSGVLSVVGRFNGIIGLVHGEAADMLRTFERNFYTGLRHNKPLQRDVVREVFGERTGNPEAKAFGDTVDRINERLREQFNALGGDMERLDYGYLPQEHDAAAVQKAGFVKWRDFILPKLDLDRMRDPLTKGTLTPDRLGEALKASYDEIVTEGWASRKPAMVPEGRGAVANQRSYRRFLHFKTPDGWIAYDREFGSGDPFETILMHWKGMARDIAAMQVFGPNPAGTVEWLKQVVQSEWGKWRRGEDSLFRNSLRSGRGTKVPDADAGHVAAERIDALWMRARGDHVVDQGLADWASDVRNVLTSAQLGAAVITAAASDPAIENVARRALGISRATIFGDNAKVYLGAFAELPVVRHVMLPAVEAFIGAPKAETLRAGMIMEDALHTLGEEARYAGTLNGNVWSRWLADRTITLSGLKPITEWRKSIFQKQVMALVADNSSKPFGEIAPRLRRVMEGYGFDAKQWETMRHAPMYLPDPAVAGFLRPMDIAAIDRDIAERYVGMIAGETERAVPSSTLRAKAFLTGGSPRGTVGSELMQGGLQYRGFGLSLVTLQAEAIAHESASAGRLSGASHAAQLMILATIGGALALQLKSIANGRDPQTMDTKFWLAAAATGGGMGIFGDFLFADYSRFGQSLGETTAGPTVGLFNDALKLTLGNLAKLWRGQETDFGKDAVAFAGRYVPLVSSLWMLRLVYRRELLDQLQYQVDPKAHRRWREEERRALRERGQGYWWRPGETAPARPPALTGR